VTERLPNVERTKIDPRKLYEYALNPEHDSGKYKAEFFFQMGYTQQNWRVLEKDIIEQHLTQLVERGKQSPYGVKYVITKPITGPSGESRNVTSVWIIRTGNDYPELVTVEPAKRVRR
jgi:hypothetical protein